jgi:hypothetical protein
MNRSVAVAASAARTTAGNSGVLDNEGADFGHIVVDVTAASGTSPVLVVTVQGVDPVSGKTYTLLASANITGVSTTVLKVGPALTAAANAVANDVMPKQWQVSWTITGTTPSFTFSVGANLSQ